MNIVMVEMCHRYITSKYKGREENDLVVEKACVQRTRLDLWLTDCHSLHLVPYISC
jgi:hypothetical protein